MRKPKWREIKEAVRALIHGPYTNPFPKVPPIGVEHYRGRPQYDDDECVGCGTCFNVCPPGAIEMVDDPDNAKRRFTLFLSRCIFCGECEANCITEKGIVNTNDWDMTCTRQEEMEQYQEKDLLLCEACGEIIGALDHVRWVAKRLGHLAYANPTMMLAALSEGKLVDAEPPSGVSAVREASLPIPAFSCPTDNALPGGKVPKGTGAGITDTKDLRRGDRLRVLCPKCRQVTSLNA